MENRILHFISLTSAFSPQIKSHGARAKLLFNRMVALTSSSLTFFKQTSHAQHRALSSRSNWAPKPKLHNVTPRCSSSQRVLKDMTSCHQPLCVLHADCESCLHAVLPKSRGLWKRHLLLTHQVCDTTVENFLASFRLTHFAKNHPHHRFRLTACAHLLSVCKHIFDGTRTLGKRESSSL